MTSFMVNVQVTLAATGTLLNKALKPFEDLDVSEKVYETGKEISVSITAKYRSLFQGDEDSAPDGSVVNAILQYYKSFKSGYNNLVQSLPASLRLSTTIIALRAKYNSAKRAIYNSYINIKNVSNPSVTLVQLKQADGSMKLKATTTASTDQTFTYDVAYNNSGFSSGLKKTINAKVLVDIDSTEIYKASAVGTYTVTHYSNNLTTVYDLELKADGTGIYTVDNKSYGTNWTVRKMADGYRLYESGFWHYAYDNLLRDKLTYPVNVFKTYYNGAVSQVYSK